MRHQQFFEHLHVYHSVKHYSPGRRRLTHKLETNRWKEVKYEWNIGGVLCEQHERQPKENHKLGRKEE